MPRLPTAQPSTLFGKGIRWLMVAVASLMLISCGGGGSDAPLSSAKDITSFAFAKSNNASLAADVVGTVSGSAIAVTLPFGQSRTALVASFIALGVSVQVGERVQRSALSTEDFSNPVSYVVTAADGSVKTYTVTVVNAHSSAKDITTFEFAAATNSSLATTIAGTFTGEAIAVVLPYGVARAALVASFASTGQTVSVAGTPQNSASSVNNFEAPVLYTVTAQDGGTRSYTVTVSNAANSAKDITSFSVLGLAATITPGSSASTGTISLVLPYGVARSALVATFASTGKTVQVASQTQTSAATSNNFETPVTYTVTADDGSSKTYTVTVTNALNPAKSLTAFALGSSNATVSGNNVTLTLPYGTDRSALVVSFVSTGAVVKVGTIVQTSGVTTNNFSSPVVYSITAEDGSSQSYAITVTTLANFAEVFVSPTGSDTYPGTLARPFKTLEAARSAVRGQIVRGLPAGGLTVWLRGGLYERSATLELGAQDSGTATSPITWRAYAGEAVRITGAKQLSPAWFTPVPSGTAVWDRLDASARGQVLQVDLRAHGITDFGTLLPHFFKNVPNAAMELFINSKAQPLGRWPDAAVGAAPYAHSLASYATIAAVPSGTSFTVATSRLSRWASAPDAWVHGYFGYYWADDHIAIASVNAAQQKITLASAPSYPTVAGQPWYAYNLLEEITQPGEWYLDRSSGLLYLWPTAAFSTAEVQASVLAGPLFSLNGASNITLQGLRLESTRASLVTVANGSGNTLQQLVLTNAGTSAVTIMGGSNHRVAQSHVVDSGAEGVIVSGGNRTSLVSSGHVVEDNEIEGFARYARTYHPGVSLSGVGQIVRNNLIQDSAHSAIVFTGNEHRIELNEIRNVLTATSDAGAIYTGRDWGARGNVIKNNFIHHISSVFLDVYTLNGIYLDDAVSGIVVDGNVVYEVRGNAIKHGGGRDVTMTNNVLARNNVGLFTDTRAYDWWKSGQSAWFTSGAPLIDLKALNYQSEPWASRYPAVAAIPSNWAVITANNGNPWLYPQGTVFSRNIGFANTTWINTLAPTAWFAEFKNNLPDQDPLFVNEAALDLTLTANSPTYAIPGFSAIPFKSIGLRAAAMPPAGQ